MKMFDNRYYMNKLFSMVVKLANRSELNDRQIKAIEAACYYRYGANIAKSADESGNALKVIAMRLRGMSAEPKKAGED